MKGIIKYSQDQISPPGQFFATLGLISVPKRGRVGICSPQIFVKKEANPPPPPSPPRPRYIIITYLDKSCLDVLVVQELGKDEEFLAQKLISKIHGCVHNPRTVRANGVGNMTDIYSVQMFVI